MITRTSKTTNLFSYFLPALAVGAVLVFLSGPVSAQLQPNYGRTYTKSQVEKLIKDVEQSGKDFRRDFDRWLDRSPLDGQQREDGYNRQVKSLASALGTLRSNFNRNNDWWQSRSDMQRVLTEAGEVNSIMANPEVRGSLDRQWFRLRRNLNRLAEAFNLPPVGSSFFGNQTGYPDQGGYPNQGGVVPSWAIGTFRGATNSGETEISIGADGVATARSLSTNAIYNGRFANNVLYFEWGSFNVTGDSRGITTTEIGNEYNRTAYNRISGNLGVFNQPFPRRGVSRVVPNWAIGTFRGTTNAGESELTIMADGSATARSLNSNQIFYGRVANGILTFDWGSFNLIREGSGISTVDVNNQQNRTSYQRISGPQGILDRIYSPQGSSVVPSWAIGTFRGMTASGESELTIMADGSATARSLNSNQVYYGRYANGVLTFDWGSFNLLRESRGISTVDVSNQSRTSYVRVQ